MKQIFTLLSVLFFAVSSNAQFSENFENYSTLASKCWKFSATKAVTGSDVITGTGSIGSDPAANSEFQSPYLDFNGTETISFNYRLDSKLSQNAIRIIEAGHLDKNGNFTVDTSFSLDKNTDFNKNIAVAKMIQVTGVYRFAVRITKIGDGNTTVIFDDLSISSTTWHYSSANPCNTAPVATNANFATVSYAPFAGTLAGNASDANGETLTFAADTLPSSSGTLVINPNGTFVFTPLGSFVGGAVKFTYYVTDNGYDPARSNTATVTITFPAKSALPVTISNFSGVVAGNKAQITWSVTQNEEGDYFQLEKSTDGKTYTAAAVIMNTGKSGAETYNYADASQNGAVYYRLKVVNKSAAFFYSRTVALQQAAEAKASNLTLLQNPVTSTLNFSYKSISNGTGVVNIYTMSGAKVASSQVMLHSGLNQSSLSLNSRLAPGAYLLEVINGSDRSLAKLVKN